MSKYNKPSGSCGKGKLVMEELDACDYADDDAYYEAQDEKRVKENKPKPTPVAKQTAKPQPLPQPKPKPAPPKPAVEKQTVFEELAPFIETELETVDDWETAMDNLDAKISAEEEQKVALRSANKK